jgi:hypothetical protein
MALGTLTSVLSNSRVNTFRVARTWEHWWHGNECFRAQGPNDTREGYDRGNESIGNEALCPPQLNYQSFLAQFLDIYNVTNRANFDLPVTANRDLRVPSTFLVLTNLYGGGGFPRQAQLGFRLAF